MTHTGIAAVGDRDGGSAVAESPAVGRAVNPPTMTGRMLSRCLARRFKLEFARMATS